MKSSGIKARHLEVFLVLMTSKNLLETAEKLSISQPAVTKAVSFMETELGVHLFERVKGRLKPTLDAIRLLPFAQRAITHFNSATEVAYGLRHGSGGQVSIAVGASVLTSLVPRAIRSMQEVYPDVTFRVRPDSTSGVLAQVAEQNVDLGISVSPLQSTNVDVVRRCMAELICEHEMVVVMPKTHALTSRAVLRPVDICTECLIALPDDTPNMQHARASFRNASRAMRVYATVGNSIAVCALVNEGVGVGLVHPLQISTGIFPDLVARPFRPKLALRTMLYQSAESTLGEAAKNFSKFLHQTARQMEGEVSAIETR